MWKWAFFMLYFVVACCSYNLFSDVWERIKREYQMPKGAKYDKKKFDAICDLIYVGCMILWPIFFIYIFLPNRKKKGKRNVHESQDTRRDEEGPHQD